jgi:hypothetical protein
LRRRIPIILQANREFQARIWQHSIGSSVVRTTDKAYSLVSCILMAEIRL